jgi:sirohydrochlorin ferrochelatase
LEELEDKFDQRLDRLEARLRKEHRELVADRADYNARKREERITTGETILSFFLGRRRTRGISTIARKQRLSDKAKMDIEESQQEIAEVEEEIAALEADLEEKARAVSRRWSDLLDDVSTEEIHPRRNDVDVRLVALAWVPSWHIQYRDRTGTRTTVIRAFPAGE